MKFNLLTFFLLWFSFNYCYRQCESLEFHIPGYNFCGPGTEFSERISRGEIGVNKLDEACRLHDTVYTDSTDIELRRIADNKLIAQAWDIVKTNDSSFTEKISASVVTAAMKLWTGFKHFFNS